MRWWIGFVIVGCAQEPAPAPPVGGATGEAARGSSDPAPDAGEAGAPVETATLREVTATRRTAADRIVFTFDGRVPDVHVAYVEEPVRCGSGHPVELPGQGWLEVRFQPAVAHSEAGEFTVAAPALRSDLGVVRAIEQTCDFEGTVTWVVGVRAPNRFQVVDHPDSARVVLDIRH